MGSWDRWGREGEDDRRRGESCIFVAAAKAPRCAAERMLRGSMLLLGPVLAMASSASSSSSAASAEGLQGSLDS